jgi:hypothetical protein
MALNLAVRIARLETKLIRQTERPAWARYIAHSEEEAAAIEHRHLGPKIVRVMVSSKPNL